MDITDIIQDSSSLILIKSQDIPKLAEALANLKTKQDETIVNEPRKPVSQAEAMKQLNRSRQTLVKWRKKGILKGFLIGGRVYFEPEEIAALQRIKRT